MMELQSCFNVSATVVANEFIDRYMASASGEYVKVYLYVLRHQKEPVNLEHIAEALNHTEADVKRALVYWERLGVLQMTQKKETDNEVNAPEVSKQMLAKADESEASASQSETSEPDKRSLYTADQVNQLAGNEEFSQLLYIAQKYLNKVFTPRECEVFAYLYDGLGMSIELLEYLVEYCVQSGHNSIRYIETVALNWHERKLDTVEKAKAYASGYMKDSFAVMKAFGIADRHPGDVEKEMINRWFKEYGFTKELVVEACNRTLGAIHSPSFRYADKILSQWKKAGVKHLQDIEKIDKQRTKTSSQTSGKKQENGNNRFHNFEQRDTDYDSLVLKQVQSWIDKK